MGISTGSGSKVFIGPVNSSAVDASDYAGLSYTEIGEIESVSEFGDSAPVVPFASLGDARVRKAKGVRDAGDCTIIVGHDPSDAGQQALIAAEKTNFSYAVKVILADAADGNDTDTVMYYRALVGSARLQGLTAGDVTKRGFVFYIDSEITEVPSQVVSGP